MPIGARIWYTGYMRTALRVMEGAGHCLLLEHGFWVVRDAGGNLVDSDEIDRRALVRRVMDVILSR